MKKYAVIVAGGSGTRMGAASPKQFLLLRGKPVIWHTLRVFLDAFEDLEIILVLPEEYREEGRTIAASTGSAERIRITGGGATRWHSVRNGLGAIPGPVEEPSVIFVHDGVRCLVRTALIRLCYDEAVRCGSAIPVVDCPDSVRLMAAGGGLSEPVDRRRVKLVQTPQTFLSTMIRPAYGMDYQERFTDEATVVEAMGGKLHLVEGERGNIKITTPFDMTLAEGVLAARPDPTRRPLP
ncbi:MAG: 2-C-methyl-D-erythritol 4-phosphate cytidylyltransferase [Bacteroidota bacterium]|nr:2-C-methyl-D-erythritol 4-phosphate cytidylyltransferase [Bacteroidota bacterium]